MHAETLRRIAAAAAFLLACAAGGAASAAAPAPEAVVLLHGLARSASSMERLEGALRDAGYAVVNVDYASRTAPIAALADAAIGGALLAPEVKAAPRVHVVTHSLGGILVRQYLAGHEIPRLGRVVMLGPPNAGSELVDALGGLELFALINGPAGRQLGTGPDSVPLALGPVHFEVGVIAGDRSINGINSLILPGPDDGKVTVERTRVDGMRAHVVVPVSHPFLMKDGKVIGLVITFLREGNFGR
jgi:triacylglycerol lipase